MQESSDAPVDDDTTADLVARLIGCSIVAIGAVAMLGWWLQSPLLVRLAPGLPPMAFPTAVGLMLAGTVLLFGTRVQTRPTPTVLGVVTVLIGAAALSQHILDIDLALDRALDTGWLPDGRPRLGRVAPATAFMLILGGSAGALLHLLPSGRSALIVPLLALGTGLIGLVALLAHLFGLDLLLSWHPFALMAVQTAFAGTLLGAGLWLRWHSSARFAALLRGHDDRRILFTAATALAGIAVASGLTGFAVLERQTEDNLRRWLALSLQNRIEVYHDTLRSAANAAATVATRPGIRRELVRLRANPASAEAAAFVRSAIGSYLELGFSGVAMQDANGREIVRGGRFVSDIQLRAPLSMAPGTELIWSDGPLLRARRVIADTQGTLGVLTTEQPLPLIIRLLDNISGLGESAEMTLCTDGSGTIRCFPTRRRPQTFSLPARVQGQTLPMAAALEGITGVIAGPFDTNEARAIVAYGPIPLTGLGMTIALGADELYRPMIQRFQYTLWLLFALLVVALAILWRQMRPLARALVRSETQAREALAQLEARQSMLNAILDGTSDAVYLKDHDGRYLMINAAGARRIGRTPEEIVGRDDTALWEPPVARELIESDRQVMASGAAQTVEEVVPLHGGERTYLVTKAPYRDEQGATIGVIGVARDITERKQAEAVVRALTLTDELTGLRNRRGFITLAEAEIGSTQRNGRAAYLFYLDLNNMKHINDRHGHGEGDRALCDLAEILRRSFRESDIIGRFGGDEFTVLATGEAADLPDQPLARLRLHLEEHNRHARRPYELSLSIGTVRYDPLAHPSFDALLHEADAAMYRTKKNRRAAR